MTLDPVRAQAVVFPNTPRTEGTIMFGRQTASPTRFAWLPTLALTASLVAASTGYCQKLNKNEKVVKPAPNVQDNDDVTKENSKVWVLDLIHQDPAIRQITVDVPGKGRKVCWYMWYQIVNNTGEPRYFNPKFELVRHDKNVVYVDQILPKVQEAIQKVEDPTDFYKVKNSVTIGAEPIPPSKKTDSAPKKVTGVAIWDDVDPDTSNFSVFVTGLSNGYSVTDPVPPETDPVVRRKTLQLKFKRVGDPFAQKAMDIKFQPPEEWKYIGSKMKLDDLKPAAAKPGDKKPDAPVEKDPPQSKASPNKLDESPVLIKPASFKQRGTKDNGT
jgi:hypothetical protein